MNKTKSKNFSLLSAWMLAARPKTLPAAVAPVIVGSALAYAHKSFTLLPAAAALAVALLLQIAVNLANDYFDYIKGIDTAYRLGPVRVTQSGLIPPARVKATMIIVFILSLLPGFYLITIGGWPVAVIGVASIITSLAYSGGPFPLASHGLGDFFVFIFFGLVAVCGTFYVQTLYLTPTVVLMATMVGLLITSILVVNNLRDIQTDRQAGKNTLAVKLGDRRTRKEYTILLVGAYLLLFICWLSGLTSAWILLPCLSLPIAINLNRIVWETPLGPRLNRTLAGTARFALIFSLLLSIGAIL